MFARSPANIGSTIFVAPVNHGTGAQPTADAEGHQTVDEYVALPGDVNVVRSFTESSGARGDIPATRIYRWSYHHGERNGLVPAELVERADMLPVHQLVQSLSLKAGIKCPTEIGLLLWTEVNANASIVTGDRIIVTTGMLNALDNRSLEAILAHEIGHIKGFKRKFFFKHIIPFALGATVGSALFWLTSLAATPIIAISSVLSTFLLVYQIATFKRWSERNADAEAIKLLDDPSTLVELLNRYGRMDPLVPGRIHDIQTLINFPRNGSSSADHFDLT